MIKDLLLFVIVLFVLSSCNLDNSSSKNEGIVTYAIEYPHQADQKGFTAFLPSELITYYKDDHFKLKFKSEFNIYNLEFISRSQGDSCFTLFKIFDKRLFYAMGQNEELFLFNDLGPSDLVIFNDSTKIIAGINCTKAMLQFEDTSAPDIEIYFSEEINISRPNRHSPFSQVPGLMLEFSMEYQNMHMQIKAQNVSLKKIDSQEFHLPDSYKKTKQDEIKDLVLTLLQ
ncbi:MAG: hypothetical protein JEZ14_10800 [Marinilabiliaceae bacterium]|nr:hypothetical protein [Marinilabiliaceae bacterium]